MPLSGAKHKPVMKGILQGIHGNDGGAQQNNKKLLKEASRDEYIGDLSPQIRLSIS